MNKGQQLYKKAKSIIPGGTMLFSKRPEIFLPEQWPSYFSKTNKCSVWDLDNTKYLDFSHMGVGTNSLGYNNRNVDNRVINSVKSGNMSTLNCPDEVELAEKLIELHPWAEMVRFARTGGEANSIAIRIARAATGKDKVLVCGYHGWHDWYLSANISESDNLNDHLLPGLNPNGVPKSLKGTTIPFTYNDINQFKQLVDNNELAAVKMEVVRSNEPEQGYLEEIRKICSHKNIVLIFDECTSGFRETFGGIHKKYNIEPDLCMFGKALGNGYAITSVIGKRNIMENAQKTFISSTFWTEKIGVSAGCATLDEMSSQKSWLKLKESGGKIKAIWKKISSEFNLSLKISGIDPLASFSIDSDKWLKYKTYITQEMLTKNFLASNVVYMSTEHTDSNINDYGNALHNIMYEISLFEQHKKNIDEYLKGPVCHSGFKRLN